jgi:DNA-binding MarR family transcriptional regulator
MKMTFSADEGSDSTNSRARSQPAAADDEAASGKGRDKGPALSWEEVGFFLNTISSAPRQWRIATQTVREEYSLRPRGPWILGLIHTGRVVFPSDLAKIFECSPSLITGEFNRLIDAGLVATRKHEPDGRQLELFTTPLGEQISGRIGKALVQMVHDRLAGYTREEILFCSRLLRDFASTLKA